MERTSARPTRRYDSPIRRQRTAETREQILNAGSALIHDLSSWDWRSITFRAVAARAAVHERTVHRHFPTEHDLRAALLQRLLDESGVTVEGLQIEDLPGHVDQLFGYLSTFTSSAERPPDPALASLDEQRKAAILATVNDAGADLTDADRRLVAAMIDVLWGLPTYRRMSSGWGLEAAEAARGVNWLIRLITEAVRHGRGPGSSDDQR